MIPTAIAGSADPAATQRHLARVLESIAHLGLRTPPEEHLALVAPLLACDAPAAWLASRPRLISWLARTPFLRDEKPARVFERELRQRVGVPDGPSFDRALRLFRHREMARIALRDLARLAPLKTIVRELSHLADAITAAAVKYWDVSLAPRFGDPLGDGFSVLAMGKYGAQELNYSSDIDVMFVLDQDDPRRRDQALALARAVIRSISATTEHGFAFRVDTNLRPYGRGGPLVQTVEEMERYYERAGQTWERAALIKARPCAGGIDLGQLLCDRLTPFVFRRTLDLNAVQALAEMKRQIDLAQQRVPRDDVKLGRGGIREVEFFAQALQLLHGGRLPSLRVRATLDALDALVHAGIIPAQDRDTLAEAYVFLRDVEHRLQLPSDRQTHSLPDPTDGAAWLVLGRRMGFSSGEDLEAALVRHRDAVTTRFRQLFATATETVPASVDAETALATHDPDGRRLAAFSRLGFDDPEQALQEVQSLGRHPESPFGARGRERHPELPVRILDEMARSPDADLALAHFARLTTSLSNPVAVTSLLGANPAAIRLLMMLLASSEALTRDFQLHPDLLEVLVRTHREQPARDRAELTAEAVSRAALSSVEESLAELRQLRSEEVLRVGLHDLAGHLSTFEVGQQLTQLAEVVLEQVLLLARRDVAERFGEPTPSPLVVLGFGSLGGSGLDYGSDLDLVVVHDATGATSGGTRGSVDANEWASRVGQRLVGHLTLPGAPLSGPLYSVDARLRPSGTQGPIVASLESFADYHRGAGPRSAELWERQALLRARPVAGDPWLASRLAREVLEPAMQLALPSDAAAQIRTMRLKLDAPERQGIVSPKKGAGGLMDIEFAVQWLQLREQLREPSTRSGLVALIERGVIERETGSELLHAHGLFRRLESRLRLMYGRADVYVPMDGAGLNRLARQLGEIGPGGPGRLRSELLRAMRRTRELFLELMR